MIVWKKHILCMGLLGLAVLIQAQNERKVIRQGIRAYEEGQFSEAEVQFRKAGDLNSGSFEAAFNTGTALYGQEKYEETAKQYQQLAEQSARPEDMAGVWHNLGNSLLEGQKYAESIEAYKNSLRLDPQDMDTKYNLAYARKKLKEQEQQQQDQNQDQQDQQDQNQDQQDQQNQDQQEQENQDQDQQEQQEQDQQPQDQEQQEQQPRPQQISKEDAQRMLAAIQQQEKDVKEKVDKKKAAAAKVKTEKDW